MAMPVTSWQGVVLGDPLYRPFAKFDGGGGLAEEDQDFLALRLAATRWPDAHGERHEQLFAAADRTRSGVISEAVALALIEARKTAEATVWFRNAKNHYTANADKLRQDFHLASIERKAERKQFAVRMLQDARMRYGPIPEAEAISGWLDILDPPPPAAVPKR